MSGLMRPATNSAGDKRQARDEAIESEGKRCRLVAFWREPHRAIIGTAFSSTSAKQPAHPRRE